MKSLKHWQDPVNGLIGIWMIASPWVFGLQTEMAVMANAVVIGVALVAVALGAMLAPREWEEWIEFLLGVWLIASPWTLGFNELEMARLNSVVTGVVVAALALWILLTDKDYSSWWHDRTAH